MRRIIEVEQDREALRQHGAVALRRSKLMRIAEEAREQVCVLTQEDLGVLPTRGYVQDIGASWEAYDRCDQRGVVR